MIGFHAADLLDLQLCNRLLIGDYGKRLQYYVRQYLFFGGGSHLIFIVLRPRAHLEAVLQLYNLHASLFSFIPFFQAGGRILRRLHIAAQRRCKLPDIY